MDELDTFEITEGGKKAAVMETGYTTYKYGGAPFVWVDIPHTEEKQQHFINTAIPTEY